MDAVVSVEDVTAVTAEPPAAVAPEEAAVAAPLLLLHTFTRITLAFRDPRLQQPHFPFDPVLVCRTTTCAGGARPLFARLLQQIQFYRGKPGNQFDASANEASIMYSVLYTQASF